MPLTTSALNTQQSSSIAKSYRFNPTTTVAISSQGTSSYSQSSRSEEYPFSHRLCIAQQKLQASDGSFMLKTVSYLRVVCSVMQKADQQGLLLNSEGHLKPTYSSLMKSLFACDAEWWKQCIVTATGDLKSENRAIDDLLRPLRHFLFLNTVL